MRYRFAVYHELVTPGGMVYHVLNRSVGRTHLFRKGADFEAFQRVMIEAHERHPIRILSLWARMHGDDAIKGLLSPWPVERPEDWTERVNAALSAKELDRIRVSALRGRPYGKDTWVDRTVSQPHLEHTVRPEGRPKKSSEPALRGRNTGNRI